MTKPIKGISRSCVGTVRAVRRFLGRKTPTSTARQRIYPRSSNSTGLTKLVHSTKALPYRTVDITSEVVISTTLYVHIFAFDLARAVRFAVNSVARESSWTQWSGASCICTLNRLGSPGVYTRRKAGPLLVATEPPEEPLDFSMF